MGTPTPPADPPQPPADPPKPPEGGPPGNGKPDQPDLAADVARLTASLAEERRRAATAEGQLTKLRNSAMTEQEKAVETARAEGRTEAVKAAGARLAAAEFRAAAAGKITDPAAAAADLDLAKYVGDDGEPDSDAIAKLVERLAAALAPSAQPGGRVPAGARDPAPESSDFIRTMMNQAK